MGDADDHMGLGYSYGGQQQQQQQQQQYGNEEQQRPPALPPPPQNIASGYYGGNTDRSDHGRPHEEDYPPSRAQRERADSTWSQNDRGRDREGTMLEWVEVVRLKIIDGLKDTKEADLNKLSCETLGLRRRECLDKLKERKRIALLKNLEYVARVEDERLQDRLARVQEAQEYHYQLEDYHNQVLELRSTNNKMAMNALQAGIGTEQRQRAEKKRKQNTQSTSSDSLAIYVSNLPTDGSVSDDLMRALFGSYGNLRKIHLYRDKQTGELKGDALIIYSLGQARDRSSITEAVCSQKFELTLVIAKKMNGAELPCGTAIKVEPSDPLYKLRKKKQTDHYGPASQQEEEDVKTTEESEKKVEEKKVEDEHFHASTTPSSRVVGSPERISSLEGKGADEQAGSNEGDEDLDDFFDSLGKGDNLEKVKSSEKAESKSGKGDDDDLDDFFASLS